MKELEVEINNNMNPKFSLLKNFLLLIFFSLITIHSISAVQLTMDSNFSQGQTLLAIVSGNFIDQITPSNVVFYRGHVKIPIIDDVVNINGDFYVYALLTQKNPGDYSMNISGVRYMKATQIVNDPIISNFSITNETADFSIDPGAVSAQENFSVSLTNLQDNQITIEVQNMSSLTASTNSLDLKSGETKKIYFSLNNSSDTNLEIITFSSGNYSYNLPVFFNTNETIPASSDQGFEFQPSGVYAPMATNSNLTGLIYLTNLGNQDIQNISFNISSSLEPYIIINPSRINTLSQGSSNQVELDFNSGSNEAIIEGNITAYSENFSSNLGVTLNFTKNFVPSNETGNQSIFTSCSDLNGVICPASQQCNGTSVSAKDGICCMDSCEVPSQSSTGSWIGWGLLIVAIIFVIWFYKKKYKKVTNKKPF